MTAHFSELHGILSKGDPVGSPGAGARGGVTLSSLVSGAAASPAAPRMSLKFVAAGVEIYRYSGRTYPVAAGQFLMVPAGLEGDVEIGRSDASSTLGLCILLPPMNEGPVTGLDAPLMLPAHCSKLGQAISGAHSGMRKLPIKRESIAGDLIVGIASQVECLVEESIGQLEALDATRETTRYDLLNRMNRARSYLHAVVDRPVELAELARVAGVSRFHLLRNFRTCFGFPPAAYHRRLRLTAAGKAIEAQRLSCADAARRYGFADGSSFSHAYKRAFGSAPLQSRRPR